MTPERRAELVKALEESGQDFHAAVTRVSDEQLHLSPEPGRWCVYEIVEHVALAENGMFRLLSAATPVADSLEDLGREAVFNRKVISRSIRLSAPERVFPTGRFSTVTEALRQFTAARENTIRFAQETELDLFRVTATHPFFGPVNGYELLLVMAGHARRHEAQIAELTGLFS